MGVVVGWAVVVGGDWKGCVAVVHVTARRIVWFLSEREEEPPARWRVEWRRLPRWERKIFLSYLMCTRVASCKLVDYFDSMQLIRMNTGHDADDFTECYDLCSSFLISLFF
jgi:hypothetical protein